MDNYSHALGNVFFALGDPTRRAIVQRLADGASAVSELASPFAMALPSFMKHLRVLERAGLIRSSKTGRTRTCMLKQGALDGAEQWLAQQRMIWEARADRMTSYVEQLHQQRKKNNGYE
ncbi:MAG: metalloregulator ArsR/SmtB family transcription factor [Steroidobacteraceae bacterium]